MRFLFRVDAGTVEEIGTGHMIRCLALAGALHQRRSFGPVNILFATRCEGPFEVGRRLLAEHGFEHLAEARLEPNSDAEMGALVRSRADVVVIDRLDTTARLVLGLKEVGARVCTFDDLGSGRAHADVAIQALLQDVEPDEGVYIGYDYLVLPLHDSRGRRTDLDRIQALVSFGGYDVRDLSDLFLQVAGEVPVVIDCDLVAGSGSPERLSRLREKAAAVGKGRGGEIRVHERVDRFHDLLEGSDFAVVAGGMTAFECARFGVPSIGLPQYAHQLENLQRLQAAGCLEMGSRGMDVDRELLAYLFAMLSTDPMRRREMSEAGKRLIDGRGLDRVVEILEGMFSRRPGGAQGPTRS